MKSAIAMLFSLLGLLLIPVLCSAQTDRQKDFISALQSLMTQHGVRRMAHPGPQSGVSWPGHTFVIEFADGADIFEMSYLSTDRTFDRKDGGGGILPLNDRQRGFVAALQNLMRQKTVISIQAQACTRQAQGHKFGIDFSEPRQSDPSALIVYDDLEVSEIGTQGVRR